MTSGRAADSRTRERRPAGRRWGRVDGGPHPQKVYSALLECRTSHSMPMTSTRPVGVEEIGMTNAKLGHSADSAHARPVSGDGSSGSAPWAGLSPEFVRNAAARRLKALGHADRLRIVELLARGPAHVGEIATALGLSLDTASRHLRVLRAVGLVRGSQRGNHVLYALADREVARLATAAYRGAAVQAHRLIAAAPDPSNED